ncbi:MAG TPA: MFS transporter, partial [Pseudomonadales bacterium]
MLWKNNDIPYWRLSSFYFFYFAFVGSWVPFWNLYMEQHLGFSPEAIGYIAALVLATKMLGPYLWGWLADYFGTRIPIVRVGSLLAFLSFLAVFWRQDFPALLVIVALYSFFWNAVLSLFEVITLRHLREHTHRYTQVRLWGSVGFVVAVAGLGALFDVVDIRWLPLVLAVILAAIWLASLLVDEVPAEPRQVSVNHIALFWRELN